MWTVESTLWLMTLLTLLYPSFTLSALNTTYISHYLCFVPFTCHTFFAPLEIKAGMPQLPVALVLMRKLQVPRPGDRRRYTLLVLGCVFTNFAGE